MLFLTKMKKKILLTFWCHKDNELLFTYFFLNTMMIKWFQLDNFIFQIFKLFLHFVKTWQRFKKWKIWKVIYIKKKTQKTQTETAAALLLKQYVIINEQRFQQQTKSRYVTFNSKNEIKTLQIFFFF